MIPLKKALTSPVGRKFVMSISGIALVLFVIVHLLGNLTLYVPDGGETFNRYAAGFEAMGPFLYVIELGLLAVILIHIGWGITTAIKNRKARPEDYDESTETKGGPSRLSLASKNMIVSGVVLGFFLIVHIWHFRVRKDFVGETTEVDGQEATNLYAMVHEAFADPFWVVFYVGCMVFLAFHLRHGFWSALQSLGAMKPEWSKAIYAIGFFVAVVLAVGFMGIPLYIYFVDLPPPV